MKTVNIDFIEILRNFYIESKSKLLEEIGYSLDTDLIQGDKIFVYKDERIKSVIVIVKGLDNFLKKKDFNIFKIQNIVNESITMVKDGEMNIKKIIDKYNEYNIIFIGHSLAGYIINKNLNNTKYNCYTYNPFLVLDKPSQNIKNYRTSGDIFSMGLIGKEIETIDIDLINYVVKNNFDIINYLIDSHLITILHLYKISINIEIPVYI